MGRSPEDYERLNGPLPPALRGYKVFSWRFHLVFGVLWTLMGTFIIVLDTLDWLKGDVHIHNWSWPVALIGLIAVWGIGAFVIRLSLAMLKHLKTR